MPTVYESERSRRVVTIRLPSLDDVHALNEAAAKAGLSRHGLCLQILEQGVRLALSRRWTP